MNKRQQGIDKMSQATIAFLEANKNVTDKLPNISVYIKIIKDTLKLVHELEIKQQTNKGGLTDVKRQIRASLIAQTVDISRKLVAFATFIDDKVLIKEAYCTESGLKTSSEEKLISISGVIYNAANNHLKDLAVYNVTEAMLAVLQKTTNDFSAAIEQERSSVAEKDDVTGKLAKYIAIIMDTWYKVDTLVEIVRETDTSFCDQYDVVRKIIEMGGRKVELDVKVINSQSDAGESHVNLRLSSEPPLPEMIIEKKTGSNGGAKFSSLPGGAFMLSVQKPGFQDVVMTVYIVPGEMRSVVITLKPINS